MDAVHSSRPAELIDRLSAIQLTKTHNMTSPALDASRAMLASHTQALAALKRGDRAGAKLALQGRNRHHARAVRALEVADAQAATPAAKAHVARVRESLDLARATTLPKKAREDG